MNRIMIDIETLDIARTATILQIGACKFSPDDGITEKFYVFVELESQPKSTISPATLKWWTTQSAMPIFAGAAHINDALSRLHDWLIAQGATGLNNDYEIWCKGTDFDAAILAHAYKTYMQMETPWKYSAPRDCRTLFKLFPEIKAPTANKHAHDALADAIHQAEHAARILKYIGSSLCH
jgi:3'-5' exoribonuclease-like protein